MTERQYKVWLVEEAERLGVCVDTVHRWRKRGRFPHLTFRRDGKYLFVSGPELAPVTVGSHGCQYDYNGVDWTKSAAEIAAKVGCTVATAHYHRYKRNSPRRPSGRPFTYDWAHVDWSETDTAIAKQVGCHPSTVRWHRKKKP